MLLLLHSVSLTKFMKGWMEYFEAVVRATLTLTQQKGEKKPLQHPPTSPCLFPMSKLREEQL